MLPPIYILYPITFHLSRPAAGAEGVLEAEFPGGLRLPVVGTEGGAAGDALAERGKFFGGLGLVDEVEPIGGAGDRPGVPLCCSRRQRLAQRHCSARWTRLARRGLRST